MGRIGRNSSRRGVAVLEIALILPLVLLLLFGILEYGWMFFQAHQVTDAARHGARIGITADAIELEVSEAIESLLCARGICGLAEVVFAPGVDIDSGQMLTVTVTVPYAPIGLGMPLVPVPGELQASVSMVKEGP